MTRLFSKAGLKILIFVLILLSFVLLERFYNLTSYLNAHRLKEVVLSYGRWAPLVFIAIGTIRPFFLVPVGAFSIAGGIIFGCLYGSVFAYTGIILGCFVAFGVARVLGSDFIMSLVKDKIPYLDKINAKRGFEIVLTMRVLPIFPVDFVSYGMGMCDISFKDFALGTLIGIIPGTIVFTYLGNAIGSMSLQRLLTFGILYIVAIVVPILIRKKLLKWTAIR
ncbi:MAG TPA: TVP38/TMEM64 family protein [Clostridiales bacterium]|nr:TVP38/TMEM64 family protein [Clostridiales bacterium]